MSNKLAGLIALIVGIGVLAFGINYFKEYQLKQKNYIETTAYVIGYEECELDDGTGTRYVAEYEVDRRKYKISGNTCSSWVPKKRKTVRVKYNPASPSDAVIAGDKSHYYMLSIGIVFIVCGIVMLCKKD